MVQGSIDLVSSTSNHLILDILLKGRYQQQAVYLIVMNASKYRQRSFLFGEITGIASFLELDIDTRFMCYCNISTTPASLWVMFMQDQSGNMPKSQQYCLSTH